jgi:hypothetical protein
MTEREELILHCTMDMLAAAAVPMAEAMVHALVQNKLGVVVTTNEISGALQHANHRGYATGLMGANNRMRWSLSDAGRHYRANTQA